MVLDTSCSVRTFLLAHRNCLSFMVHFLFQMVPGMDILKSTQGCSRKQTTEIKQGPFLHEHYYHSLVFQLLIVGDQNWRILIWGEVVQIQYPTLEGWNQAPTLHYYSQIFAFLHMHSSVLILPVINMAKITFQEFYLG